MREVSATDAARGFSELLDAVEHRREAFSITRGGRTIARIGPAPAAPGRIVKEILARHRGDPEWSKELHELRELLVTEERRWPD